jgi:hypothetical protein
VVSTLKENFKDHILILMNVYTSEIKGGDKQRKYFGFLIYF